MDEPPVCASLRVLRCYENLRGVSVHISNPLVFQGDAHPCNLLFTTTNGDQVTLGEMVRQVYESL